MYSKDILVIAYPSLTKLEAIIIVDPFDKKTRYFSVDSLEEAREILRENLPFCSQNHDHPIIHLGGAYVTEWEDLPVTQLSIKTPNDIEKMLS